MSEKGEYKKSIVERVIEMRIEQGFIDEDLNPIMCRLCQSKNMKKNDIYVSEGIVMEYGIMCDDCGAHLGHCYCGKWDIDYFL